MIYLTYELLENHHPHHKSLVLWPAAILLAATRP